jgi:NAD(P)-dependent dehydrogenase (short-subunit alcohol dehydrogenase family)
MDHALEDRAVVVTGAGRGLGAAYARAAARAGACVLVNDVHAASASAVADEIARDGGRALAFPCSVTDPGGVRAMFDACVEAFGRVDGLVNNAALGRNVAPWDEPVDALRRTVEVNVLGALLCGREAIVRMRAGDGGVIVNVTSGARLGMPRTATYGATKGAVASMTFGWSIDAAAAGVRVNAVSPVARTPMSEAAGIDVSGMAEPDEIAPVVVFLLSERSAPLTGRIVRFDGRALTVYRHDGEAPSSTARQWTADAIERTVMRLALTTHGDSA